MLRRHILTRKFCPQWTCAQGNALLFEIKMFGAEKTERANVPQVATSSPPPPYGGGDIPNITSQPVTQQPCSTDEASQSKIDQFKKGFFFIFIIER